MSIKVGLTRKNFLQRSINIGNSFSNIIQQSAAAYSLRKLIGTYNGSAIRVRRSSDNAELDVGFNQSNNLDSAALLSFVGSNDGFVTTWYDQSNNNFNASQATAINQPAIVTAGLIVTEGINPAVQFNGNQFLISNFQQQITGSLNVVCKGTDNSINRHPVGDRPAGGNGRIIRINATANFLIANIGGGAVTIVNSNTAFNIITGISNAGQISASLNGNLTTGSTGVFNIAPVGSFFIGGQGLFSPSLMVGTISEVVGFNLALSDGFRLILERNQGAYYGITVA